ncbi:uncharacterized protein LOC122257190 [Penaeus japonicus]|uniref:uncharacterized protein LOC122257190 n=1 Tax=Penaeus japonicus TaxID=27405 RepID=UPI001C70E120|nr:uncharacterized protein LOC122257190 [Penaeus japonicus]
MWLETRHHGVLLLWCLFSLGLFHNFSSDMMAKYFYIPDRTRVNSKPADRCRSLFTINEVFKGESLRDAEFAHDISKNESGFYAQTRVTPYAGAATYGEEELASAAKEVQQLVHRRASSSGPDTDDYRVLGSLLARLVSFDRHEGEEEAPSEAKEPRPHIRGGSRIAAGGSVLPFVPCVIAPYDQPASFAACVRRRLEKKGSFWIYFMGDSKIREVFMELLKRTDQELNYRIEVKSKDRNQTLSYAKIVAMKELRQEDMRATSAAADGLMITMSFRVFVEMERPSILPDEPEVTQLRRWADGADPLPDILIIGYTSWMLQRHRHEANILELQDGLFEMHKAVVPHIEKISQLTRVLVLPQSRPRPYAVAKLARSILNVANFDWSEKMFLHLLQRHSNKVNTAEKFGNERPRAKFEALRDDHDRTRESHGSFRDHLIPGTSDSGPWWWDSSLPINLAEIDECNELHRRDLAGDLAYTGPPLQCQDIHHAGEGATADLVTMLFNLMCNSVLKMEEDLCCA